MRMDIEVHASFELTARQQGQRRMRLREREHRLQRDDNNTDDGPTSLQTQHHTPPVIIIALKPHINSRKGQLFAASYRCRLITFLLDVFQCPR